MLFSDIFKKGYGTPTPSSIIEGGLGIDVQNKKAFSKGTDGNIFQIGLTDEEIQAIYDQITLEVATRLPSGVITIWSGSIANIPEGWVLCDGNNATPNLTDKFVIGAGATHTVGASGGSKDAVIVSHSHTNSVSTNGAHTHTVSDTYMSFSTSASTVGGFEGNTSVRHQTNTATRTTSSNGDHSHTVTVDATGVSGVDKNLPPYYALAYIMKS